MTTSFFEEVKVPTFESGKIRYKKLLYAPSEAILPSRYPDKVQLKLPGRKKGYAIYERVAGSNAFLKVGTFDLPSPHLKVFKPKKPPIHAWTRDYPSAKKQPGQMGPGGKSSLQPKRVKKTKKFVSDETLMSYLHDKQRAFEDKLNKWAEKHVLKRTEAAEKGFIKKLVGSMGPKIPKFRKGDFSGKR
jgi:hypothetical protein